MAWNKNYSKVRNAIWIWYLMALACFVMAVKAYPVDGGSMIGFVWWVSSAAGLAFSAGRAKRKEANVSSVVTIVVDGCSEIEMAERIEKALKEAGHKNR